MKGTRTWNTRTELTGFIIPLQVWRITILGLIRGMVTAVSDSDGAQAGDGP